MSKRAAKQVKNRAPAAIQITAEQLLLEAQSRAVVKNEKAKQVIASPDELDDFKMRKRKEFEDSIRRQRQHVGNWLQYAQWEADQKEWERARSVFERALDVDYKNQPTWMRYAEMEMKNKFINHARNVWDRAVTLMPRVETFWFKYTYMEEMLGNINNARAVFERWMKWNPEDQAWLSYAKLEVRAGQVERARAVYERYLANHPTQVAYLRYAKWELRQSQRGLARRVFERGVEELPQEEKDERLFLEFGRFEASCREFERARIIYKFGLDSLPREVCQELYKQYVSFEKQHGDQKSIEDVIVAKRRQQYEDAVRENPHNFDAWFDYVRLEEGEADLAKIRDTYERAVANIPPVAEKQYWKRYLYLWINYALFEELDAKDVARAREVYKVALSVIPHAAFTFAKLWLMAAHFEVRQLDLTAARKIFGLSLGKAPREKVFQGYLSLEINLGNVDRARSIYHKYLETMPHNCKAWSKFAELEGSVGELERARAIYELAINQPILDMPELLWKSYIDFEISQGEFDNVRALYERLLDRTKHVKVWISFATFESNDAQDLDAARGVFRRASDYMKQVKATEERVLIIEAWYKFEVSLGEENAANIKDVSEKRPRKMKKKRLVSEDDGASGWEEYVDYVFPDDERGVGGLKLLENAAKWKAGLLAVGGLGAAAAPSLKRKAEELEEEAGVAAHDEALEGPVAPVQDDAELDIDDA